MKDLSIIIPARNEMFLAKTIEDILANIEADTEIIAVLDGGLAGPAIPQHERVNVIYLPESIGQRAATNTAARLSNAKYVMKCDAHCSFDKGFDRKMIEAFKETGDNVTMVPIMRNLWAFDWKCLKCGKKWYQGPTPTSCQETDFKKTGKPCDSTKFERKIVWVGKNNPQSTSYCFDSTPHFQYFEDWKHRPQYEQDKKEKGLTETMSLQGSCWMLTRERYWELEVCDENFGSWGSQGIEVACKTWLSGGRVLVNHKTWYAHMFRTQGGDFGFPYPISNADQEKAKTYARELFFNNNWPKQIRPLSWLVEKFWPVKGWAEEDLQKLKNNTFKFQENTSDIKPVESEPVEEAPERLDEDTTQVTTEFNNVTIVDNLTKNPKETDVYQLETREVRSSAAIVGEGFTTELMSRAFPEAYVYNPPKARSRSKVNKAGIVFICYPDLIQIEEVLAWIESPLVVIRSTVSPGTCDYLTRKYGKKIVFQPEYLGLDQNNPPFILIGGSPNDRHLLIDLYTKIYKSGIKIKQVSNYEAEIIKLTENRAIAFKLAECRELYDVCGKAGIDYYLLRDAVYGDDPRFTLWGTFIGKDQQNDIDLESEISDLTAWYVWADSMGSSPEITESILKWANSKFKDHNSNHKTTDLKLEKNQQQTDLIEDI